jgi:hypothetical protein|tara:strand:+ start:1124 stop:1543 length:420 start_codon:yes stop_codon:yes gene_type:complete
MKSIITTFIFSITTLFSFGQLSAGDNVYLQFQDTDGEVNVDGDDACEMLKSYVIGKTSLSVVSNKEESDYTLVLYVIEKNVGNRKGKIDVLDSVTGKTIFESKWKKGTMNALYGYSGTRHAIGRVFKGQVLKEFKQIKK